MSLVDTSPIGPNDGPVAVTGSGGFIGSHIVLNLVQHGYEVRACVRDKTNLLNCGHLTAMNNVGPGSVTLWECDLTLPGDYDEVFKGCSGVFHAAAEMGNLEGSTPRKVYEGCFSATQMIMDSIKKSGTVRRLVYTSSFSAVGHPADEDHVHTEDCWADMNMAQRPPNKQWTDEVVERDREVAYAKGKTEAERYVYTEAEQMGIAAFGVCPCHVIGPLLSANHQRPWSWQTRIGDMMEGFGHPRMFWNIVDVRDVAETQRLIAESPDNRNGECYNLVARDESGEIKQTALQEMLRKNYPDVAVAGVYREGKWRMAPLSVLQKPVTQLGLKPHTVEETVRDNVDSLVIWGLIEPLLGGVNDWQREGNDLGIVSKWSPHEYPAIDPSRK